MEAAQESIGMVGGKIRDDTLTFAEAMALDPGEVEVEIYCGPVPSTKWLSLSVAQDAVAVSMLRQSKFRRYRPKRSRVEEMACPNTNGIRSDVAIQMMLDREQAMTEAIRAVADWLAQVEAGHMIEHDLPGRVRREFLEPR